MAPHAADSSGLRREALAASTERVLRRASGAKPAIILARWGACRVIVKDFSQTPWLVRHLYGRWVVGHEARVYARLAGLPGVPAFRGRVDAFAIAVDYIEGATLKALSRRSIPVAAFEELAALLDGLHARGVIHLDCHQKTNIVLSPGGRPHLVDFASALCVGTGWLARRVLVPLLGRADRGGLLKLKARYHPEALGPAEARRLRRAAWLGWLWPPNLVRRLARWLRPRRRNGKRARSRRA